MLSHYIYILSIQKQKQWLTVGTYIWKCSSCNRNKGCARPYALQDCGTGHFKTQNTRMNRIPTLTPARNVRRPGVALLGQWNQVAWNEMSPESGAAYQLIWTEQRTVSFGRKIMNKTLFLVVKKWHWLVYWQMFLWLCCNNTNTLTVMITEFQNSKHTNQH